MILKKAEFVGILTIMNWKKSCLVELSMKYFYNLGARSAVLRGSSNKSCKWHISRHGIKIENKAIHISKMQRGH